MKARIPEYHGEDWQEVKAYHEVTAAEILAKQFFDHNCSDYTKNPIKVEVILDNGTIKKYDVIWEYDVLFFAEEVKE